MSRLMNACQECGEPLITHCGPGSNRKPRAGQEFCCREHRQDFNNRRMQRGAEMYDLFRALRRERGEAKDLNLWTMMCRLELKWQEEDAADRPGRRSYMPPDKALNNLFDRGAIPRGEVLAKHYVSGAR